MPWMDQMGYSFLVISVIIVIISILEKNDLSSKAIPISKDLFKTGNAFNVGAVVITAIIATLYIIFW